ncbi:MAG: hypothetical protein ABIS92_05055, partial [Polyangia bacterium]
GNCVFAEYHGFITVDYVPGSIPNTSADSVIHQFRLAPKNGGSAQTFVYTGDAPFTGHDPADAYPIPTGLWQPELDPTRPYCLTISAFGQGDIARLPVSSQSICVEVVQLSAAGAPPPPQIGGDISDDGGGSSDGGRAGGDAGSSTAGGGGCSLGGGTAAAGMPAGTLLLALVAVLCRRRHQVSGGASMRGRWRRNFRPKTRSHRLLQWRARHDRWSKGRRRREPPRLADRSEGRRP